MSGHRSFETLRARMSPERRARNAEASDALIHAVTLAELRSIRQQSQKDVAAEMRVLQPAVAKLERRGDMCVSNLMRYIEALGGTLEMKAHFPDASLTVRLEHGDVRRAAEVDDTGALRPSIPRRRDGPV